MTTPERTSSPQAPVEPPSPDPREIALRMLCVTGLGASTILLVDYVHRQVFCTRTGGGCDAVRRWATSHVGAPTVPVLGVTFFLALLAVVLAGPSSRSRRLLGLLGLAGCAAGVGLMVLQAAVIHAFCKYCLVVDVSALASGVLAVLLGGTPRAGAGASASAPRALRRINTVTVGAAAIAFVLPLAYGLTRPDARPPPFRVESRLPESIAREQRPGTATIVEFVDYECPFCRRQQEAMAPVLASYGERVRLVRRNVPLSQIHPHAMDAARAACCADEQGHGERMAAALFRAEDLTPEGCARIAHDEGMDMDAFRACLASHRPDVSIERDHDLARSVGVQGLPTFWIGNERYEGLQSPEAVRASLDRALARSGPPSVRSGT